MQPSFSRKNQSRVGYSLIELMLALGLTVLVTGLIGFLIQLYFRMSDKSVSDVRQTQLARSLLQMIADDLRSVVRYEEFDTESLTQALGSQASSAMGSAGGGDSGGAGGSSMIGAAGGTSSGEESGSEGESTTGLADSTEPPPIPGLYGNQYELLIDVSRLPRPDQYFGQQANIMDIQLNDVPSDIKSVCYYIQAGGTIDGVQDILTSGQLTGVVPENVLATGANGAGGMVRRQLDRTITQWANSQGQSDRLRRTGELVAPEVVAMEFAYFDGTTWLTQWDSSQQNLPRVVQITLAMQDPTAATSNPLAQGTPITNLTSVQRAEYGVRIYQLSVAIPGAQLIRPVETDAEGAASMGITQ